MQLGLTRKIIFSLFTAGVALFAFCLLAEVVDRAGLVDTHREVDRVHHSEGSFFTLEGDRYVPTRYGSGHGLGCKESTFCLTQIESISFAANKGERWRMFLLGGSFLKGDPFIERLPDPPFQGISTWLTAQYKHLHPTRETEILNTASVGIGSDRVADIAEDISQYEADAWLLASCNNEGGAIPDHVKKQLHQLGGYRLVTRLLVDEPDEAMRSFFVPQECDSNELDCVERPLADRYSKHLMKVVRRAADMGVPLLIAAMPINLRFAALGSVHEVPSVELLPNTARADSACVAAVKAFKARRLEDGIKHLEKCKGLRDIKHWIGLAYMRLGKLDEGRRAIARVLGECIAEGIYYHFKGEHRRSIEQLAGCENIPLVLQWTGLALYELGETDKAMRLLKQSVEVRPMSRCRPSLNRLAREIAARHDHVHLVDLEAAAERASPRGVPGPELFIDSCHMTWRGYAVMAEEVRETLERTGVGPRWATSREPLGIDALGKKLKLPPAK